ncbi:hypothetical protein FN846DRAFT_942954, partial [Sphaerosporella brunnea]
MWACKRWLLALRFTSRRCAKRMCGHRHWLVHMKPQSLPARCTVKMIPSSSELLETETSCHPLRPRDSSPISAGRGWLGSSPRCAESAREIVRFVSFAHAELEDWSMIPPTDFDTQEKK